SPPSGTGGRRPAGGAWRPSTASSPASWTCRPPHRRGWSEPVGRQPWSSRPAGELAGGGGLHDHVDQVPWRDPSPPRGGRCLGDAEGGLHHHPLALPVAAVGPPQGVFPLHQDLNCLTQPAPRPAGRDLALELEQVV